MIHPMDFLKYGFALFLLSMAVVWVVGFLGIYNIIGFPEGVLETARTVLESGAN
jgi:sodium-dependent dicarboxylate transporter 2/3/5